MQDLKDRREKLLAEATDCELIGNLATDDAKRATFRRLAQQFRTIAEQLEADMDQGGNDDGASRPARQFARHAGRRVSAATGGDLPRAGGFHPRQKHTG